MEDTFERATAVLRSGGGLVTVVLGSNIDAPTDWSLHPRVYWLVASELRREDVGTAIPSNTRLMLFTDNINEDVFHPLHQERQRRRLPYMVRKTGDAVDAELLKIFEKKRFPIPAPAPSNGNGGASTETPASPIEVVTTGRGRVRNLIERHMQTETTTSIAEEARRLFKIAQQEGLETTPGAIAQAIRMVRRDKGIGTRPESAMIPHVADSLAASAALDAAIAGLTAIKARVERLDAECAGLRKERDTLAAKVSLLKESVKDL